MRALAFSEVTRGDRQGNRTSWPGLKNPIIEFDLANKSIHWESCSVKDICEVVMKWIECSRTNRSKDSKIQL